VGGTAVGAGGTGVAVGAGAQATTIIAINANIAIGAILFIPSSPGYVF
jgi:hypothetical protein